jgi:hypothetical protein
MFYTILHCLSASAGAAFLYCGLFLYEKEENALHNRLDSFWKSLDRHSKRAVGFHSNIVQRFADIALAAINKICGERVWSSQNFFATACLSVMSVTSFAVVGALALHRRIPSDSFIRIISHDGGTAVMFAILLFLPLVKWMSNRMCIWRASVGGVWVLLFVLSNGRPQGYGPLALFVYFDWLIVWAFLILGFMVFSGLCKKVLNAVATKSVGAISVLAVLIYLVLIVGTALTIKANWHVVQHADLHGVFFVSSDNIFAIVFIFLGFFGSMYLNFALFIFFILALLLLHSVLWGIVNRPIYAMSRHKIFNRHKTLCGIGLILLGLGVKIPSVALEIVKAF